MKIYRYMGLSRFELLTLRLSGVYSNQLSYKPQNLNSINLCNIYYDPVLITSRSI